MAHVRDAACHCDCKLKAVSLRMDGDCLVICLGGLAESGDKEKLGSSWGCSWR